MPNKLITDLAATSAVGTSVVPVSDAAGTVTNKVALADIAALGGGAPADNSVSTAKLVNSAVTYQKIQSVSAADKVLGRSSAGAGVVEEIACTAFGRTLLASADAAAGRTNLAAAPLAGPAFTGQITVPGGSVTAPTLAPTGDTNTGLYFPATDTVALGTNGVERLRISSDGTTTISNLVVSSAVSGAFPLNVAEGRLTLVSGYPYPAGNTTAANTLYYTPTTGNKISLYDNTLPGWRLYTFSELSLSLASLAVNTNYDIFVYNNAGTLALEATAWTNDTLRVALVYYNGVLVSISNAASRRYVGTIRTIPSTTTPTTTQCEDSFSRRLVWNKDNQTSRNLIIVDANPHTYTGTSNTYRAWRNVTTIGVTRADFVTGTIGDGVLVSLPLFALLTQGTAGIGIDTTTDIWSGGLVFTSGAAASIGTGTVQNFYLPTGYHYIQAVESAITGVTSSFTKFVSTPTFMG